MLQGSCGDFTGRDSRGIPAANFNPYLASTKIIKTSFLKVHISRNLQKDPGRGIAHIPVPEPISEPGGIVCNVPMTDAPADGRYAASLQGVREAAERIAPHAHVTPVCVQWVHDSACL